MNALHGWKSRFAFEMENGFFLGFYLQTLPLNNVAVTLYIFVVLHNKHTFMILFNVSSPVHEAPDFLKCASFFSVLFFNTYFVMLMVFFLREMDFYSVKLKFSSNGNSLY